MNKHQVSVRAAYKTVKVSSYFSLKDKCSDLFRSNVVYRFTCSDDKNSSYIGETKRHLFERIVEHCLKKTSESAIFDHLYQCDVCQNVKNIANSFEIIQHCDWYDVLSCEALLITILYINRPSIFNLAPERGLWRHWLCTTNTLFVLGFSFVFRLIIFLFWSWDIAMLIAISELCYLLLFFDYCFLITIWIFH